MAKQKEEAKETLAAFKQVGFAVANEADVLEQSPIQHPAEYEQWVAQYKTIYLVEAQDEAGVTQRMYVRKPDYNLQKACILTIMKDPVAGIAAAGELILASCVVGGYDMRQDEDMHLAAVFQVAELVEMKNMRLKKSSLSTAKPSATTTSKPS